MSGMGLAMMGTGVAEGPGPRDRSGAPRDFEPAARRRVGQRRARRHHQRHRRPGPVAGRSERRVDDRAGSRRRGRQHHLRRRRRSGAEGQGEDHVIATGFGAAGRAPRARRSSAQTPVDMTPLRRSARLRPEPVPPPAAGRALGGCRSRGAARLDLPLGCRRDGGAPAAAVGGASRLGDADAARPSTCRRSCGARRSSSAPACRRCQREPETGGPASGARGGRVGRSTALASAGVASVSAARRPRSTRGRRRVGRSVSLRHH